MHTFPDSYSEDEQFTGLDCSGAHLEEHTFIDCQFVECDFSRCDLSKSRLSNCLFERCNLSNVKFFNARLTDTAFAESKLTGVDYSACNPLLFSIRLAKCKATYCLFTGLDMPNTAFQASSLIDCIFEGTNLSGADFSGCDLQGSSFDRTHLEQADFRGAVNYTIHPQDNYVAGARFSYPEVLALLHPFGVVVE